MIFAIPSITGSPLEASRVRRTTAQVLNLNIDASTERTIQRYMSLPRHRLTERILELEKEWSVERWLETSSSTLGLTGLVLAASGHRSALWLSGTVAGFLLMHGVSGWCPPLPWLRRLGVRTRGEIDVEKFSLKYLRGDFEQLKLASREGRLTSEMIVRVMREVD